LASFAGMFVYFWFPDYIFTALSLFNWIAWIQPTNFNLTAITGSQKGLGFNPIPTFDWNIITHSIEPLQIPFHVTANWLAGTFIGAFFIIGVYWTNTWNTAYLPINSNSMFTHYGGSYNVSKILDSKGWLDEAKYQAYSPVYFAASNIAMYYFFFAAYAATISYTLFYHSNDIKLGFRSLYRSFRTKWTDDFNMDVHSRLMSAYKEGQYTFSIL
jgi:hypothetical protein